MKLLDEAACIAFSAFSPVTDGICIIATGLRLAKAIDDDKCDPANVPSGPKLDPAMCKRGIGHWDPASVK